VFVNGTQVGAGGTDGGGGSLVISSFEQLLDAMTARAAGESSQSTPTTTQVQIWKA
jgi:hypothetical protein